MTAKRSTTDSLTQPRRAEGHVYKGTHQCPDHESRPENPRRGVPAPEASESTEIWRVKWSGME